MSESSLSPNENARARPLRVVLVLNVSLAAETQDAWLSALAAASSPLRGAAPAGPRIVQCDDPWLALGEAAQHMGISTSTLYKYASQGKIESRKLAGRLQFRRSLLDRFMAEQVRPVLSRNLKMLLWGESSRNVKCYPHHRLSIRFWR